MKQILLSAIFIPTVIGNSTQEPILLDLVQEKCLAVTVYGEARGESYHGQLAVAYTVINRAKKKSICNVALAPKQYSVFNDNPALRAAAMDPHLKPHKSNPIDQKSWNQAVMVARVAMHNLVADPTNGATHYLAPKLMKTKKFKYPKWSRQYTLVKVIDGHKFYKMNNSG